MSSESLPTYFEGSEKPIRAHSRKPSILTRFCTILLVVLMLTLSARRFSQWKGVTAPIFGSVRCQHNDSLRGGLPTHYTLPTGDKIPSVALGML